MEKRFFYAFLLTILLFIFYSRMMAKYIPSQPAASSTQEAVVSQQASALPQQAPAPPLVESTKPLEEQQDLPQAEIGKYILTYSPRGGYVVNVQTKADKEGLLFKNLGFVPAQAQQEFQAAIYDQRLVFTAPSGIRKEFVFQDNLLQIRLTPAVDSPLLVFSNTLSPKMLDKRYQEFFYSQGAIIERRGFGNILPQRSFLAKIGEVFGGSSAKPAQEVSLSDVEFAGSRNRYFCLALAKGNYTVKWTQDQARKNTLLYLIPTAGPISDISLYFGLQNKQDLQHFGLEGIVYYGFFHGIAVVMLKLLYFLHAIVRNWGLSIILFSIAIYLLLFPLTSKSAKGMKEMREFQELHSLEIKKLKEKYKDNPQKMHQETMTLYKKNNFSPLKGCSSGCLPMFFQIPLIWAFWAVVPRALEFKGAKFLWIKDLSLPDRLFPLPFSLPFSLGPWINILPILTAVLMYLQMRFTSPAADPEQAQQQKIMGTIFPVMMILFLYNLPSALLLYWFVNSILTFLFQWKIMQQKTA